MRIAKLLVSGVSVLALVMSASCSTGKKKRSGGGAPGSVEQGTEDQTAGGEEGEMKPGPDGTDPVIAFEPDRGIKTGSQIRNTYLTVANMTPTQAFTTDYTAVETSLPLNSKMQGFDAGKQSAIVKLAIRLCSDLVDDTAARDAFFPGFTDGAGDAQKALVAKNLIDKFWGAEVEASGMNRTEAEDVLMKLQTDLVAGGATPINAVKGACAAAASALPTTIL